MKLIYSILFLLLVFFTGGCLATGNASGPVIATSTIILSLILHNGFNKIIAAIKDENASQK